MTLTATLETFVGDDFLIAFQVSNKDGSAKDLTGATAEVWAQREGEADVDAASPTISGSTVQAQFDEDALSAGVWSVRCRVTIGDVGKTVYAGDLLVKA